MGNVSEKMKSLCEEIIASHNDRGKYIRQLRGEAQNIRDNARRFLAEIRADLKEAREVWNKMNKTLKVRKRGEVK